MIREIPTISNVSHSHTNYSGSDLSYPNTTSASPFVRTHFIGPLGCAGGQGQAWSGGENQLERQAQLAREAVKTQIMAELARQSKPTPTPTPEIKMATPSRRLVQVFIVDPDENVPLESAVLYSGEQKLTDLTDQELFFEIDIKSVLDKHNAARATIVNKKIKERTEYLEPVKVRDLKMAVVKVAEF